MGQWPTRRQPMCPLTDEVVVLAGPELEASRLWCEAPKRDGEEHQLVGLVADSNDSRVGFRNATRVVFLLGDLRRTHSSVYTRITSVLIYEHSEQCSDNSRSINGNLFSSSTTLVPDSSGSQRAFVQASEGHRAASSPSSQHPTRLCFDGG